MIFAILTLKMFMGHEKRWKGLVIPHWKLQNAADIDKLKTRSKSGDLLNIHERMQRHSTYWCVRIRVCVFNVTGGEHVFETFVCFIDTSQIVCKVMCLHFVEIDYFDAPNTENMHCAKLPDAQDDRIWPYIWTIWQTKSALFYQCRCYLLLFTELCRNTPNHNQFDTCIVRPVDFIHMPR